ncbi:hypothetical protein TWF703_003512 [Orbilia oligospora]|uniref:WAP domain-containing protein n=1 Tax=Orbilia oligospora TaxID=2813651 RepID=A0A7C8NY07_ORBOL|nr:hypothetical protein TWF703_003512 [Orbilia oligospora]
MRIPSFSISLLSISLPTTLADYVSYNIEPGKLLRDLPGGLAPSKPDFSKRSFLTIPENKPLPRWIPRMEGIANPNDGAPCINDGFGVCPSRTFCCPSGRKCLRDADGKAACERVCEDANFFVCPSNDFCCPTGSSCFVDGNGRSRCKVTIVTTITASSDPPATTTSVMNSSSTDMEFTTTSSSNVSETTSAEESPTETTSTTDPTNSTIETTASETTSPDPTETPAETSSSTTETAEAVSSTPASGDGRQNNNNGPLPPPNGGLDNIFTNEGERTYKVSLPVLIGVGLGFFGFVIGML